MSQKLSSTNMESQICADEDAAHGMSNSYSILLVQQPVAGKTIGGTRKHRTSPVVGTLGTIIFVATAGHGAEIDGESL